MRGTKKTRHRNRAQSRGAASSGVKQRNTRGAKDEYNQAGTRTGRKGEKEDKNGVVTCLCTSIPIRPLSTTRCPAAATMYRSSTCTRPFQDHDFLALASALDSGSGSGSERGSALDSAFVPPGPGDHNSATATAESARSQAVVAGIVVFVVVAAPEPAVHARS